MPNLSTLLDVQNLPNLSPFSPNLSPFIEKNAESVPLNERNLLIQFSDLGGNTILEH